MSLRQIFGIVLSALAAVATTVAVVRGLRVRDKNDVIESQSETIDRLERTQEYSVKSAVETRKIQEDYSEKVATLGTGTDPVADSLELLRELKGGSCRRVRPDNC